MADLARLINAPDYERWRSMVAATGGCAHPVHLAGGSMIVNAGTGEVLHAYTTDGEPSGHLMVACGNRRASVCPACSQTYQADTFHLIRAGLSGGKGIPESVSAHPRAFVTLTAPSFGPVHSHRDGRACRPRKHDTRCEHRRPIGCHHRHQPHDERLGQPLCPDCYDYTGAVLWQAHAGALWHRFTLALRQELATQTGMTRRAFAEHVKVSFAKVAEYQRRGLIHFHAIIRLDGPAGPHQPPPDWADHHLLTQAIPPAAQQVTVTTPPSGLGRRTLTWGPTTRHPPHPVRPTRRRAQRTRRRLLHRQVRHQGCRSLRHRRPPPVLPGLHRTRTADRDDSLRTLPRHRPQARPDPRRPTRHRPRTRIIRTCWELGARPEFRALRLRPWAHMLGFRGHFSSKSRAYSLNLTDLRNARAAHRAAEARERHGLPALDDATTLVLGHWRFAGIGYTSGEAIMAEHIRQRVQTARHIAAAQADE